MREYFAEALDHMRQVWNDLRSGTVTPEDVRRHHVVARPGDTIDVD